MNNHRLEKDLSKRTAELEKELAAKDHELEIEAALEKVRSRSLAMHKSEELQQIVTVAFERLKELNISMDAANIVIFSEGTRDADLWIASPGQEYVSCFHLPYVDHLIPSSIFNAREKGNDFFANTFSFEEKNKYFNYLFEHSDFRHLPENRRNKILAATAYAVSFAFTKNAAISIHNYSDKAFSDEENNILRRFAKVFEQAYIRFLDLQKAEVQAREAQIQLALERVRARTMAMQRSDELPETAAILFEQFKGLGQDLMQMTIGIVNEADRVIEFSVTDWSGSGAGVNRAFNLSIEEPTLIKKMYTGWKENKKSIIVDLTGKELENWINYRNKMSGVTINSAETSGRRVITSAFFSRGHLSFSTPVPPADESIRLLERFAQVFDLTYTRFLDLKKAEAQAREAQIELGLERVRARAMAMQKSDELSELVNTVFKELTKLDFALTWCIINIIDEPSMSNMVWAANPDIDKAPDSYRMKFEDYPFHHAMMKGWKERKTKYVYVLEGLEKRIYDEYLFNETEFRKVPEAAQAASRAMEKYVVSFSFSNFGGLQTVGDVPLSDASLDILSRFGKVFDLTYTRFNDLKQAEAQARESQIQLALERVRARTMAMQHSDELKSAAALLFQQVKELGVPAYSCGYNIWEKNEKEFTSWMSSQDGTEINGVPNIPLTEDENFIRYVESKQKGEQFFVLELRGERMQEHYRYLKTIPAFKGYFDYAVSVGFNLPETQIHHLADFSHGNLLFITLEPCPQFHDVFKRFAAVFEQTYTRFLDLQKAEAQAREAKIEASLERVRSKAMAMHDSKDLTATIGVFYQEIRSLSITPRRCGVGLLNNENRVAEISTMNTTEKGESKEVVGKLEMTGHPVLDGIYENTMLQKEYHPVLRGNEIKEYYKLVRPQIDYPDYPTDAVQYGNFFPFTGGSIFAWTEKELPEDELKIYRRFTSVLGLTYRRYKDLKEAEAQAREAKIEASMERIRARAMAMHSSDELMEVANVLRVQMGLLDQPELETSALLIYRDDLESWDSWYAFRPTNNPEGKIKSGIASFTKNSCELTREIVEMYHSSATDYTLDVSGTKRDEWLEVLMKTAPEIAQNAINTETVVFDTTYFHFSDFNGGSLLTVSYLPPSAEIKSLQRRAASVFDLAYRRFHDLKKAESQAREAQIEAALERVRSRSMGMQKSDELKEVIRCVYEQFVHLNIHVEHTGFIMDYKTRDDMHIWLADQHAVPFEVAIPYFDCAHWNSFNEAKEKGRNFFANHLSFEEKNKFYQDLFKLIPGVPKETLEYYFSCPGLAISTVLLENVGLYIENFSGTPYSDKDNEALMRFGKVFQQTYTRFLDLQKAEAQAREAKIEAVLERIRSRTMAMQKSDELTDVAALLFKQVTDIGIKTWTAGFNVWSEDNNSYVDYITSPNGGFIEPYTVYTETAEALTDISNARKSGVEFDVQYVEGEKIKQLYLALTRLDEKQYEIMLQDGIRFPSHQYEHFVFGSKVSLMFITYEPVPEAHDIFKRLGKVFEQTYTRFLDLQRAEAQALESQIEAALERVRSRTMAMQHSDELKDAALLLFQQVQNFGVDQWACGYNIWEADGKTCTAWMSRQGTLQPPFKTHPSVDHCFQRFYDAKQRGESFYVEEIGGEEIKTHYKRLISLPEFKSAPREFFDEFIAPEFQIFHIAYFEQGYLMFITYRPVPQTWDIFKRFAKVFEQTYTRFLDLKKAEAQALEVVKRASVDRVRAEIASMRTTNDLERITPLIWNELTTLGVPFIRCGVFIMDDEKQQIETHLSTPNGEAIAAFNLPYSAPGDTAEILAHWHQRELYKQHWNEVQFVEFTQNLVQQGAITSGEKYLTENHPTDLYLHFLPFLQGMLYAGNTAPLNDDALQLMQNLADAFSTAYARYEDFNKLEVAKQQIEMTLVDLKQAQQQLVQSEKMASLGELTAGIAHEIQNPLNFVNNFSDVNKELLEELKEEAEKGNIEEIKAIATDVINNEERINHHGKRADAIVKNMLQHSRSSGATKELTDINRLADEYLRLSYHGLRAKDKSFNADFKTDFDDSIGKINVIPQDIGRVLLNLFNNAFYAVNEKLRAHGSQPTADYKPLVSVQTRKRNAAPGEPSGQGKVEIIVKDNGNGIPQKIVDKIFQPFFTTKPTGQGTGLGLSLSYDIIKAHGGEIKVQTKEGEGSEFVIQLAAI